MEFTSTEQVIKKAIEKEIEACNLYTKVASLAKDEAAENMLTNLAAQEQEHRQKLENLRPEETESIDMGKVSSEVVTSHPVAKPLSEDADIQEIVVFAIKREEAAEKFYLTIADGVANQKLKDLFLYLAKEENKHKTSLNQTFWDITYTDRKKY